MFEVHIGHDDIVFNINNKGINKLEVLDILTGNEAIIQVVSNPIGILGEEEPVSIRKISSCTELIHTECMPFAAGSV